MSKRRGEISGISLDNFKVENDLLTVTFTLEKKKRKHKKCPSCDTKNSKVSLFCKKCGLELSNVQITYTSKQAKALKAFPTSNPLTQNILKYLTYLRSLNPVPKFWLPSGKAVFGYYVIVPDKHLSGRAVFNIVRNTSDTLATPVSRNSGKRYSKARQHYNCSIRGSKKTGFGRCAYRF